jgi:hypothetical protein
MKEKDLNFFKKLWAEKIGNDNKFDNKSLQDTLELLNNQSKSTSTTSNTGSNSTGGFISATNSIVKSLDNGSSATARWSENILDLGDKFGTAFLAIGDSTKKFKDMFAAISNLVKPFMDLDQALRDDINKEMGITGQLSRNIRNEVLNTAKQTKMYGIDVRDVLEGYTGILNTLGRSVPLSNEFTANLLKQAKASGVSSRNAGQFAGQLERMGVSIIRAPKILESMSDTARSMGLNTSQFIETATSNLKLINTLGFKEGVDGFTKIAAKASLIKFDLTSAATKASELFEADNAIEMAAQLNVLGGEYGRLGNAIDLMFMPTNDMEGFTDSIMEAQKQFVSFNSATQEFQSSPLDLRRAKEFAKIMGKDVNTVMEEAKSAARRDMIKNKISFMPGMDENDRELIASLGQLNKEGNVTVQGKLLSDMSEKERDGALNALRQENKKGKMSTDDILREQMTIGTAANRYLEQIALQVGAFGNSGGLISTLGDDLNDMVYGALDEAQRGKLFSTIKNEGTVAALNGVDSGKFGELSEEFATELKTTLSKASAEYGTFVKTGATNFGLNKGAQAMSKQQTTKIIKDNSTHTEIFKDIYITVDGVTQKLTRDMYKTLEKLTKESTTPNNKETETGGV